MSRDPARDLADHLPGGLTARPLTLADAPGVYAAVAAEESVDLGEPDISLEDVLSDWQRPSYDIATSTLGVLDGERLVAYADVAGSGEAYAAVHPDHQGRGIGTALATWVQATARARGYARIGGQVPQDSAADRLMTDLGYRLRWTAWDLELPDGATISTQPLPEGFAIRDAAPGDHETSWTVIEDAFTAWGDRERVPFEDFAALVWDRPGFEPWNLRLVEDPTGSVVGATHVHLSGDVPDVAGYVARIAVRRDRRGLGLARAMLVDAFGLARGHGAVRCHLSTDSRTGALGLYQKVGMTVASTWVSRAIEL